MAQLNVELTGYKEIAAKLSDPEFVKGPLRDLLFHAATIGKQAAMGAIDGGTGLAVTSIKMRVSSLDAEVYSAIAHARALSIEEGRKPGETIPYGAALRWLTGRTRGFEPTASERKQVAEIRAAVRRGGTKGKRFIQTARDRVTVEMPRLIGRLIEQVKEGFGR